MGSAAETAKETVDCLTVKGEKVGLVNVHLYRPFFVDHFLNAIPKICKRLAVLDRTREPGSMGEPLYQDVKTIVGDSAQVFGGRYGLGSKEFKPRDVKAVYENLMRGELKHNFTVGIEDDLTGLSLKPTRHSQ